jgi:hypothetical protein
VVDLGENVVAPEAGVVLLVQLTVAVRRVAVIEDVVEEPEPRLDRLRAEIGQQHQGVVCGEAPEGGQEAHGPTIAKLA